LVASGLATALAEGQLIEKDPVLGSELPVLDLVLDEQRHLALLDRVAGVLAEYGDSEVISIPLMSACRSR
jgi:hypothetical protein